MKILLVNYEFPPLGGGAATATDEFAKEFRKLGHEVHVLTTWFPTLRHFEKQDNGYVIHRVSSRRKYLGSSTPLEMLSFIFHACLYCLYFIKKFRPDHTVAFFGIPSGVIAYFLKKKYDIPYTIMLRGGDVPGMLPKQLRFWHFIATPFICRIWKDARFLIANSKPLQQLACATGSKLHKDIYCILNGIDTESFKPIKKQNKQKFLRLLSIGRVDAYKGFDWLLHSLVLLREYTKEPFILEIVGEGPFFERINALKTRLTLDKIVFLRGRKNRNEIVSFLQSADIFIHPSRSESMSNSLLEAMACGLPVVASDIEGNRELITNGVNGFLVTKDSVRGLSDVLLRLFEDRSLQLQMGLRNSEISKGFQWSNSAQKLMNLIEN